MNKQNNKLKETEPVCAPLCPRCQQQPRAPRRTGGYRSWCRACESAQKADYMKTPPGRAAMRRWYHKINPGASYVHLSGQAQVPCWWCAATIDRQRMGGGTQVYCGVECKRAGQRHRKALNNGR